MCSRETNGDGEGTSDLFHAPMVEDSNAVPREDSALEGGLIGGGSRLAPPKGLDVIEKCGLFGQWAVKAVEVLVLQHGRDCVVLRSMRLRTLEVRLCARPAIGRACVVLVDDLIVEKLTQHWGPISGGLSFPDAMAVK